MEWRQRYCLPLCLFTLSFLGHGQRISSRPGQLGPFRKHPLVSDRLPFGVVFVMDVLCLSCLSTPTNRILLFNVRSSYICFSV